MFLEPHNHHSQERLLQWWHHNFWVRLLYSAVHFSKLKVASNHLLQPRCWILNKLNSNFEKGALPDCTSNKHVNTTFIHINKDSDMTIGLHYWEHCLKCDWSCSSHCGWIIIFGASQMWILWQSRATVSRATVSKATVSRATVSRATVSRTTQTTLHTSSKFNENWYLTLTPCSC